MKKTASLILMLCMVLSAIVPSAVLAADEIGTVFVSELYKAEINVSDYPLLTDGQTGFSGTWGNVGTSEVVLINNPQCRDTGMDVVLNYDLGKTASIDGVALDFYHCASVMIGYPSGHVQVDYSIDGVSYDTACIIDLSWADVDISTAGTVRTQCKFDTVEASCLRIYFYVGDNESVLGSEPADGKRFWEFVSLAEITLSEVASGPSEETEYYNLALAKRLQTPSSTITARITVQI